MDKYVLSIDQGTTSSRAIIFDSKQEVVAIAQSEFTQYYPNPGWVEHDPQEIFQSVLHVCELALSKARLEPTQIASVGITNQRETVVIWDRVTGAPVYNAIVWQDRRTADFCTQLQKDGHEPMINEKTGLILDPYFSGTKINWVLNRDESLRARAKEGNLLFGTIDSFLIWKLTSGHRHVTDATNASRTMLYNIRTNQWDLEILDLLEIPQNMCPEVLNSADDFGVIKSKFLGAEIPINGVAGDQQAALIGNACFSAGMTKITLGTGCFSLTNVGDHPVRSENRLLTTIAYRLNDNTTYALEGSIFMGGAIVQWLRDGLSIIEAANECDAMASAADPDLDVVMVPAFVGLGAPHWDPNARGSIFGLTRGAGRNEIVKAALESVCYQCRDLIDAKFRDMNVKNTRIPTIRVDGGMAASNWTIQYMADIINTTVDRPTIRETTALGAAWLAASHQNVWPGIDGFKQNWKLDKRFSPSMLESERVERLKSWQSALNRTFSHPA